MYAHGDQSIIGETVEADKGTVQFERRFAALRYWSKSKMSENKTGRNKLVAKISFISARDDNSIDNGTFDTLDNAGVSRDMLVNQFVAIVRVNGSEKASILNLDRGRGCSIKSCRIISSNIMAQLN
jgi:hypothetical protein